MSVTQVVLPRRHARRRAPRPIRRWNRRAILPSLSSNQAGALRLWTSTRATPLTCRVLGQVLGRAWQFADGRRPGPRQRMLLSGRLPVPGSRPRRWILYSDRPRHHGAARYVSGCSDVVRRGCTRASVSASRERPKAVGRLDAAGLRGHRVLEGPVLRLEQRRVRELNVGMIAGVAVAIFVVVAGCIGVCCFGMQEAGGPVSRPRCPWSATLGSHRRQRWRRCPRRRRRRRGCRSPRHKKQRRFPDPSAPLPPTLAPIKAQAAGMMLNEETTPPQPSAPVAEPVQSTSSVGWGARSLRRLASGARRHRRQAKWNRNRRSLPRNRNRRSLPRAGTGGPCRRAGSVVRGLGRARAAAPRVLARAGRGAAPITLGGKKVDVAQEELCSPRRVGMVHASVERWYNTTGKGAAAHQVRTIPRDAERSKEWYARNKVMTAFLDDQGVPPKF